MNYQRDTYFTAFYHLTFSTKHRLRLLTPKIQLVLQRYIVTEALGLPVIRLNTYDPLGCHLDEPPWYMITLMPECVTPLVAIVRDAVGEKK